MNRFEQSLTPASFSGLFSGDNRKPTLILLLTPILLTTYKYYGTKPFYMEQLSSSITLFQNPEQTAALYTFFSSFFLLGVIPLLIIKYGFKEPLSAYGIQLGDWRYGLKALLVLGPIMVLATYPSSKMPDFLAEYPLNKTAGSSPAMFLSHAFAYLFFYIGWETYFRGFMQFGLREKLGDWNALLIQTAFSCILHIGKPSGEIYSSILGALVWGVVAFRTRSLLVLIITHWLLGISLDFYICYVH
ncbi:MAG: type II CAAX endopeptidase family protein [bacterium]